VRSDILILGGTGSIGYAVTANLLARRIPVTLFVRNRAKAERLFPEHDGLELREGDAQDAALLNRLAADKTMVFHGLNYPYNRWFGNMDTVTAKVIAAASLNRATVVFPGNVYGFGLNPSIREDSPAAPKAKKGALRLALEGQLREAAEAGRCRVLNVRLPDFWGPNAVNAGTVPIFRGALAGKPMPWLLNADLPHQFAYTPDAAGAIVRLWLRAQQPGSAFRPYEVVNYGGTTVPSIRQFFGELANVAGTRAAVKVYPKWLMKAVGLFDPVVRELGEMFYLYENTVALDDAKFRRLLPDFRETPLRQAMKTTLDWFKNNS